ncbi:MAG TPA: ABC transporter substrate-binding protein [Mycobacteriales bacterium]|nr:ABC transporter substrate-binding protein [Mycobacteriales bacterium]
MTRLRPVARTASLSALLACAAACAVPGHATVKPPGSPAAAHVGGTLRIGIAAPSGVDPIAATNPSAQLVDGLLCDTLLTVDPQSGEPAPGLVSGWTFSGSTLTLQLRHGVHFSDGSSLTASDVAFSLGRLANPSFASPAAGLLNGVLGYSGLQSNLFAKPTDGLAGVQVVNDHTVQVTLSAKDTAFLYDLAMPATAPVSANAERAHPKSFVDDPVCVGPYRLRAPYRPGAKTIALTRVPGYYAQNPSYTGGGRGYAARVTFEVFGSQRAGYQAYRHGKLDLLSLPPADRGRPVPAGSALASRAATTEEFIGLPNGADATLSSVAVRHALSESLDREAVAAKVWGGGALPATGYLPAGFGASSAGTSCGAFAPITGNAAQARASLTPAELSDLRKKPLTLTVESDPRSLAEAATVADEWRQALGVRVKIAAEPWSTYLQQATVGSGFLTPFRIAWQAGAISPSPTSLDPGGFLYSLFSQNSTTLANWAHYSDLRFDTTYSLGVQPASPGAARDSVLKAVAERLCQQMPIIPLAVESSQWLVRSSAWASTRSSYLAVGGTPLLRELYLERGVLR